MEPVPLRRKKRERFTKKTPRPQVTCWKIHSPAGTGALDGGGLGDRLTEVGGEDDRSSTGDKNITSNSPKTFSSC